MGLTDKEAWQFEEVVFDLWLERQGKESRKEAHILNSKTNTGLVHDAGIHSVCYITKDHGAGKGCE